MGRHIAAVELFEDAASENRMYCNYQYLKCLFAGHLKLEFERCLEFIDFLGIIFPFEQFKNISLTDIMKKKNEGFEYDANYF